MLLLAVCSRSGSGSGSRSHGGRKDSCIVLSIAHTHQGRDVKDIH